MPLGAVSRMLLTVGWPILIVRYNHCFKFRLMFCRRNSAMEESTWYRVLAISKFVRFRSLSMQYLEV